MRRRRNADHPGRDDHRDDILTASFSDHVARTHNLSWPDRRAGDERMARPNSRGPRCPMAGRGRSVVAAHIAWRDHRRGPGRNRSSRHSLRVVDRRRAIDRRSARGRDGEAGRWQNTDAAWYRPAAGGNCTAAGTPHPYATGRRCGRFICPRGPMNLHESWRLMRGVTRSLRIYYGDPTRRDAMDAFYGDFVRAG